MPRSNSTSLFHFTSCKDILFKILRNGLRFSYCYEPFGNEKGMAVPMICFCDIPLMRSLDHRSRYGNYAIGFDKDYLLWSSFGNLNPIQYIASSFGLLDRNLNSDIIVNQLDQGLNNIMNLIFERYSVERVQKQGFQIVDEELRYVLMSLSAAKIGYRNQRIFSRSYIEKIGNRKINNYKEREWRLVPILDESDEIFPKWVEKISEEEFNQSKEKFSKAIIDSTKSHVIIPTVEIKKAITSIIVKNEKMVAEIISKILKSNTLFGSKVSDNEDRLHLISKVTSFERIENDY